MTREFIVEIANQPGTLVNVTKSLVEKNVNITGVSLAAVGKQGFLRLVTSDPAKTEEAFRGANIKFQTKELVTIRAKNQPGELSRLADKLAKSGVNIESVYPVFTSAGSEVELAFEVDNEQSARKALGA